jgi:hypothetical protein
MAHRSSLLRVSESGSNDWRSKDFNLFHGEILCAGVKHITNRRIPPFYVLPRGFFMVITKVVLLLSMSLELLESPATGAQLLLNPNDRRDHASKSPDATADTRHLGTTTPERGPMDNKSANGRRPFQAAAFWFR